MTFLLDVNVLVALIDPSHVSHDAAHRWFAAEGRTAWATCPLTENGVIRIVGNPRYPNSPGSPSDVTIIFQRMSTLAGHSFWPDDLSLTASDLIDPAQVRTPGQVTDTYLLALAVSHEGQLATFDRRLSPVAVAGGRPALHVISG